MIKKIGFAMGAVTVATVLCTSSLFALELKKTIAVADFENKSGWSGRVNLGSGMADQLTDALIQSGKFVVVERQILDDIIEEQDLAASGRMAASQAAKTGKLVPAQILIKGTVTEFQHRSDSSGTGISYRGISLGSSKSTAHVAVILRIIDTTSGQVLDSVRVEGEAKSGGITFGVDRSVDFNTRGFKATPLGKAVQIAIDRAVVKIVKDLKDIPFSGKIIKVEGPVIYTNIGARNGGNLGDTFRVYAPGEELIDYDTGETLGSEKKLVGEIRLTSVDEKFSKAAIESGSGFEKGYIVTE